MNVQQRMSPFTAFFMAIFGIVAVGVGAGTTLALFGLYMIDNKAEMLIGFAEGTIDGLPELIADLPPAIGDVLDDRRVPEYAPNIDIDITLLADEKTGLLQPALTIANEGDEVISMLAVRVAALTEERVPIEEWTQVVATPIAIEDDWRGPLFPHETRHVVLRRAFSRSAVRHVEALTAASEISELRIWRPAEHEVRTASVLD